MAGDRRTGRRFGPIAAALLAVAAASSACTPAPVPPVAGPPPSARPAASLASPHRTAPPACPVVNGLDCDFRRRIAAVAAYLTDRPGTVGIVLRDRRTGAIWRNDRAGTPVWTASTIKLAMATDLLARQRTGAITLDDADRADLHAMLESSDDEAADRLWFRYAGADHRSFNRDFVAFGMTGLQPEAGFTSFFPYWGFQKCTPADLDRLLQYVLTRTDPRDRAYLVGALQAVAGDQRWGVWSAGPALQPGNKNGWSLEQGGWVINSVGFAGPAQRYTLSIMNSLNGAGGYDDGVRTVSRVAQLLLTGRS